jgi:hypothetical protein
MRRRDVWFCRKVIERLARGEGFTDETLIEAGLDAWRYGHMSEAAARRNVLRRAKATLRNPDVMARFTELFELGGFNVTDAVAVHVAAIREGNYQALRDYWKMTQPAPTKQVDVRTVSVAMTPADFDARAPHAIAARVLGVEDRTVTTITSDVSEAPE